MIHFPRTQTHALTCVPAHTHYILKRIQVLSHCNPHAHNCMRPPLHVYILQTLTSNIYTHKHAFTHRYLHTNTHIAVRILTVKRVAKHADTAKTTVVYLLLQQ